MESRGSVSEDTVRFFNGNIQGSCLLLIMFHAI